MDRTNRKCIVKQCDATNISGRGLCMKCYYAARNLIRTGKTSWEELQRMGLARAPRAKLAASPLVVAFAKKKAGTRIVGTRKIPR